MKEAQEAKEVFFPRLVRIDSHSFFPNPGEQPRDYQLKGQLLTSENGPTKTALLLIHGAAGSDKNPAQSYSNFQQRLAGEAGFSSLVFDSRGVGTGDYRSNEEFDTQSLNDRSDDALNALFYLDSSTHPQHVIISAVSMGGHVAVKMLEKLHDIAATADHPQRQQALSLLTKVKGIGLFAPAAYPSSTEFLPAKDEQQTRTKIWRSYEEQHKENQLIQDTDIFHLLDRYRYKWPLWIIFGENDSVILPPVQQAFKQEVFAPDDLVENGQTIPGNFQIVPGQKHDGLLGEKFSSYHSQFIAFAQKLLA